MSEKAPLLRHGSHAGHAFDRLSYTPQGEQCTICKATAYSSQVAWYRCCDAACSYLLCHKCFEIDERPFSSMQVVIRNPLIPHDDPCAAVHTRPKPSSYKLAPLYAGKFMEVVSSAVCTEDPTQTYFRLRYGGWINSGHVVCVIPAEKLIESLARIHLSESIRSGSNGNPSSFSSNRGEPLLTPEAACEYATETIRMLDENPPYGIVMAAIALYPIHYVLSTPLSSGNRACYLGMRSDEETRDDKRLSATAPLATADDMLQVDKIIRFLHSVLHFALTELECSLDDGERIEEGTLLSILLDVIVGCVLVAQDLHLWWRVRLPVEFLDLLLRTVTSFGCVHLLLRHSDSPSESLKLWEPAVIVSHADLPTEHSRLRRLSSIVTDAARRLLLDMPSITTLNVKALMPMREKLSYGQNEVFQRTFCDILEFCMRHNAAAQRQFLQVDPLEIVVRLSKSASLAESQISIFRLIATAVHRFPRNIAFISSVVVPPLMKMANAPHSPAVLSAALDCVCEMAFNDPRIAEVNSSSPQSSTPNSLPLATSPRSSVGNLCTHLLYPNSAPFQLTYTFTLPNSTMVNFCESCAARHPPSEGESTTESMEYRYFRCQCICCRQDAFAQPLPPPTVPQTFAIQALMAAGLPIVLKNALKTHPDNPAVVNAVGRVALCVQVTEDIILTMFHILVGRTELRPFAEAALALASHSHLVGMENLLKKFANTPLVCYILKPYTNATPVKVFPEGGTPFGGASQAKSELGLSPSPHGTSVYASSLNSEFFNSGLGLPHCHPPVNLFLPTVSTGTLVLNEVERDTR